MNSISHRVILAFDAWTEDDHPRDKDGKFAKNAGGASAGASYHAAEAAFHKLMSEKGELSKETKENHRAVYRSHNRAATNFLKALDLWTKKNDAGALEAWNEASKHHSAAQSRKKKFGLSGSGAPPAAAEPPPSAPEVPAEKAPQSSVLPATPAAAQAPKEEGHKPAKIEEGVHEVYKGWFKNAIADADSDKVSKLKKELMEHAEYSQAQVDKMEAEAGNEVNGATPPAPSPPSPAPKAKAATSKPDNISIEKHAGYGNALAFSLKDNDDKWFQEIQDEMEGLGYTAEQLENTINPIKSKMNFNGFTSTKKGGKKKESATDTPLKHGSKESEKAKVDIETHKGAWLAANVEKANSKIAEIAKANSKEDLGKIEAFTKPLYNGALPMSLNTVNNYLNALKKENGIEVQAPAKASASPSPTDSYKPNTPAQKALYTAAKGSPHHESEHTHIIQDASGKKLKAKLHTSTEKIANDGYAMTTSAYAGGDEMSHSVSTAMQHYAQATQKLMSPEEKSAASTYKGNGYVAINKYLLGKSKGTPEVKKNVEALDNFIREKSAIPADTPCWRGLKSSLKDLTGFDDPEHAVGRAFVHDNFASVSRDKSVSENFGNTTMMRMTLKAGTPGLVLGGQINGENEIVLPTKGSFKIVKVEQEPHPYDKTKLRHIIHVEYLGSAA